MVMRFVSTLRTSSSPAVLVLVGAVSVTGCVAVRLLSPMPGKRSTWRTRAGRGFDSEYWLSSSALGVGAGVGAARRPDWASPAMINARSKRNAVTNFFIQQIPAPVGYYVGILDARPG